MPPAETGLAERAARGDRAAFDRLVAPALPAARAALRRLVGHPEDCEDVLQDALVRAWSGLGGFRGEGAFGAWFRAIALRAGVDHLRARKRWRTEAQVAYANLCAGSEALSGEVMAAAAAPDFAFEVREHIAYCFACVGRSLPPDEQAALVLRDVLELSAREASDVLGVSDSVLRHRLSAARTAMQEKFDGLCALVGKGGICHQCAGLRMLAPGGRQGGPLPDVAGIAERAAVARESPAGAMAVLHDLFWRRTKAIEAEGAGSVTPDSGCGEAA
jgi:RNA polymerase sigma-70 factor (ECF subfamily)